MSSVLFHPHCELVSRSQGLYRGKIKSKGVPRREAREGAKGCGRGWGLRWSLCPRVFSEAEGVTLGPQIVISILGTLGDTSAQLRVPVHLSSHTQSLAAAEGVAKLPNTVCHKDS